jgi:hypothetical protein
MMDRTEARAILQAEIAKYRQRSYDELLRLLDEIDAYEVRGPTGAIYQLEVQGLWDDRPGGNLRVMAGIDDGGQVSAFAPLVASFILSPDGEFVGE